MDDTAPTLRDAYERLRAGLGMEMAGGYRLLCCLAESGDGRLGDLVEATGIPHRRALEILRALGLEADDQRVTLGEGQRAELRGLLEASRVPGPDPEEILGVMSELAAGLPAPVGDLDHVPATVGTIVARAEYLRASYDLAAAHLVCLGDHDLTSVATALLVPGAAVSVVDVDEAVLEYLGAVSDRLGLGLRLYGADLRLGLPRSLRGSADLVFTDPPYSQEGVALFVQRGIEALADRPAGRVLFCYGVSDRGAEQLLAVQDTLARRHIVLDALPPGFNRYRGAHAIGAASGLWVCRPTRRTRPALQRLDAADGRIYSRGAASRESERADLPPEVLARAQEALGPDPGPVALVGEGWGTLPDLGDGGRRLSLAELIDEATEQPQPGSHRGPRPTTMLVNLHRLYGASAIRVLTAAPPGARVILVLPSGALPMAGPLRRLAEARYRLQMPPVPAGAGATLLVAEPADAARQDGAAFVLRWLAEHQAARLRNAWREALCQLAARQGAMCTKNQARALVEAAAMRPAELDSRLLELPLHRLARLVGAVGATVGELRLPAPPEG